MNTTTLNIGPKGPTLYPYFIFKRIHLFRYVLLDGFLPDGTSVTLSAKTSFNLNTGNAPDTIGVGDGYLDDSGRPGEALVLIEDADKIDCMLCHIVVNTSTRSPVFLMISQKIPVLFNSKENDCCKTFIAQLSPGDLIRFEDEQGNTLGKLSCDRKQGKLTVKITWPRNFWSRLRGWFKSITRPSIPVMYFSK
jgi:hypothetical protein